MHEDFDPYSSASDDRYRAMAAIRADGGIADTAVGTYVATFGGVLVGLREVERFVGSFMDTTRLPEDEVPISAIPEPRHGRIRRVINTVVAPHRTATVAPFIRDLADDLVAQAVRTAAADGRVDLVSDVVDPFPSAVIARVLGIPDGDRDQFRRWSDELLSNQLTGASAQGMSSAHPEFAAYIQDQIDQRRRLDDPPDDVITRFLRTEIDGERLSDTAIRTQTMFLIVAGNETTRNLIGNCLYRLSADPDLYARCRADEALLPIVVEETLRLDSPVQVLARAVLEDTEIEGHELAEGDRVVFGLASANRDESLHHHPDEFRTDRDRPRDHVAFGAGPHVCPGAFLARLEAATLIGSFCAAVATFATVSDFVAQPNPVFWALGHRSLPVILEPA